MSDVPAEIADLLAAVYTPRGIEIWWEAKNRCLNSGKAAARCDIRQVAPASE